MATKKMETDELLDQFKEMTLLELSEFIKRFEETFDVQAAVARVAPTAARMVAMDWTKRCRRVRNAPLHHWDKSPDGRFRSTVG